MFPVWINMCIERLLVCVNPLSHNVHLNGVSPVWVNVWDLRWPDWVNPLSQILHLKGLSRVWINICVLRLLDSSHFLQLNELNGLSPVWINVCVLSLLNCVNPLQHTKLKWSVSGVNPYMLLRLLSLHHVCRKFYIWRVYRQYELTFDSNDCQGGGVNPCSHIMHWSGFSPVWIYMCLERLLVCVTPLSLILHIHVYDIYPITSQHVYIRIA